MKNRINTFFHCAQCIKEMPSGESPETWARLSVGMTPDGFQVWCVRHDINVAHIPITMIKEPLQ